MEQGDEFPANLFKLLILLWSFIKLQPQRRGKKDFDSTLAGEENAFVFTVRFCFLFAFRIKSTPSSDKSKFLMLFPFLHLGFGWSPCNSNTSVGDEYKGLASKICHVDKAI